jgi:glucose-6-phosphate 1-epimerase
MSVRAIDGRNGQPAIALDGAHGRATIYVQGAHVTSWIPAGGAERLFVSRAARFAPGDPIRGGVPVCFPQFAELGTLPMHGFAQVLRWEWRASGDAAVELTLRDTADTRALWPHRYTARLLVALEPATLRLEFRVRNDDDAPLQWSGTLHTFVALDARHAVLRGLGPAPYVDRGHGSRPADDPGDSLGIPGHVDRAYLDAGAEVRVDDGRRRLVIGKAGFRDTVVWNPGPETSARFPDLEADDHQRFVCIEAAEVRRVEVAAGAEWRGRQVLRVPTD